MADGWERFLILVGVLAAIVGRSGCALVQKTAAPRVETEAPDGLAVSVTVVATLSHRLIATPEEIQGPSRLVAVYARLENAGTETFLFNPANVTLTLADGTVGRGFDRQRAAALIERLEIAPAGSMSAQMHGLPDRTRAPGVQELLKRQLIEGLLDEGALGSEAIQGYLLLDTNRRSASLEGAVLYVSLTRVSDGAPMRQVYRFAGRSEAGAG